AFQFAGQDIPWLLSHWAKNKPDHPFLIWEPKNGAGRQWTYSEFVREAADFAAGLSARGVGKGDKVLIHSDNCPEMVLAWYACARIGAVGVTTNTRSVAAEVEYFANHTKAVGAITQPQYAELIAEAAANLGWYVVTDDDCGEPATAPVPDRYEAWATLEGDATSAPERPADPTLPAGIMFTSGTTSRPKAVVHTHANAIWTTRVAPRNIDLRPGDTYLIYLPFFHTNAQTWSLWAVLGVGGTIVLQPKFSSTRFWEVVQKHAVTHISLIPFVFKALAGQERPEHSIRVGVFGLVMPVLEKMLGLRVLPAYGMTETVIHAIHAPLHHPFPERTMGWPTPGYEAIVVNPDTEELCPPDETGELWLRGTRGIQLFLEYLDNPEANEKAFTADGWFRTGDMVRVTPEGYWFYSERDKDLLKVGGENVSARHVEDTCRAVGGIADIAVVGQSHEMLDQVPVAFVVKSADAPDDDAEFEKALIDHCADQLSDFKVPRAVYFVDDFPRATLDKVAKNKLRDIADAKRRSLG
ncbi:MAG: acyl--CoA ligase, partial [Acidimicrobiales bacterium]|nr:acyl--CoA ligase [Acidimicrobiales bacterium]